MIVAPVPAHLDPNERDLSRIRQTFEEQDQDLIRSSRKEAKDLKKKRKGRRDQREFKKQVAPLSQIVVIEDDDDVPPPQTPRKRPHNNRNSSSKSPTPKQMGSCNKKQKRD